ncbi:hypothetical protein [Streptomyces sp. NPDC005907]|uniref:hypothetical protein n=1 Tax=Streptomyces sp. NPDC005907 TaxID=3154571 RepID=UPI0033D7DECC
MDTGAVSSLVVSAVVLQEGAEETLRSVLHEAAHILNWMRDIPDTTTRGAYHTQPFIGTAEEVGLHWPDGAERRQGRGFADVVLTEDTLKRFAPDLHALNVAIPQVLPHITVPEPTVTRASTRVTLQCKCTPARKVSVGKTVAARGPILCGVCGGGFTAG